MKKQTIKKHHGTISFSMGKLFLLLLWMAAVLSILLWLVSFINVGIVLISLDGYKTRGYAMIVAGIIMVPTTLYLFRRHAMRILFY